MHIGLIGGIGPAATVAYYLRLVDAFRAADIPLELTIVQADLSVLAANALAMKSDAQADVFAMHLAQLAATGCDIAAITALTCTQTGEHVALIGKAVTFMSADLRDPTSFLRCGSPGSVGRTTAGQIEHRASGKAVLG